MLYIFIQVSQCLISLTANNPNFILTASYLIGHSPHACVQYRAFSVGHLPHRYKLAVKNLTEFSCINFFLLKWTFMKFHIFLRPFQFQHCCKTSTSIRNGFIIPASSHQHSFINPNSASLSLDTLSSLAAFKHHSSHAWMIIHCVLSLKSFFFFFNAVHIY